ncbi:MAG: hypothetical protein PF588_10625 [Candidatus Kapabacteria bacterium]|jgi:hypothetical protein|nr:hypothetical protein [Candidatus Kapabacteria bacterium]
MPQKTVKDRFKNFSACLGALFIAYLVLKLFVYLIATAATVTFSVATVAFIVILALPLYVILRKKLFK